MDEEEARSAPEGSRSRASERRRVRTEIRIGIIVGVALLVVGIPVTLVSGMLQQDISEKDPTVTVTYESRDDPGRAVVFPGGKATSGTIDAHMGCAGKAVNHGAVDFQQTPVRIEVTGVEGRTVVIEDIRAEKVRSGPPSTGTVLSCVAQGGGRTIDIALDLDEPSPRALKVVHCPYDGACTSITHVPYFDRQYVYLESQKPEVFWVDVIAQKHDYDWVLKVEGTVDGERRTWVLKNGDKPFRTAGRGPAGAYTSLGITPFPPWESRPEPLPGKPMRCPPECLGDKAAGG